jgi:hypothetical protein
MTLTNRDESNCLRTAICLILRIRRVVGLTIWIAAFAAILADAGEMPMECASIISEPSSKTVFAGDEATFGATVQERSSVSYQWQRIPAVGGSWSNLADTEIVQGVHTPFLTILRVESSQNGDRYRLVIDSAEHHKIYSDCAGLLVVAKRGVEGWQGVVHVLLSETNEAFRNPMKGFRPTRFFSDPNFRPHEYASVYKHYIRYTDLESLRRETAAKISDWSNREWAGVERENVKVIPRVVIYYPDQGEFWADGIPHVPPAYREGNWTSEILKERLVEMILKLGVAWDNDPRVAAVELGLWGKWGEHHIDPSAVSSVPPDPADPTRIPPSFQKAMGDAASRAFRVKKVLVRYPNDTFLNYNFGCYWDSFALPEDEISGEGEIVKDVWRTQMNSGEVAFDWGTQSAVGGSPNGALMNTEITDYITGWIRRTHTSSLGWISDYDAKNPGVERNARRMQEAMGYRYVLKEASYSRRTDPGGELAIEFTVTNVGSAPFYYSWPVQAVLLRVDRSIAWRGTFNTDITRWIDCRDYSVSGKFILPSNLKAGTYVLALCVCDPSGMLPSLRFANVNYYRGGWTPIGTIGLAENDNMPALEPFDRLADDQTLHYVVPAR